MEMKEVAAQKMDAHHRNSCDSILWSFGAICFVCNEPVVLFYGLPRREHFQKRQIVCSRCPEIRSGIELK